MDYRNEDAASFFASRPHGNRSLRVDRNFNLSGKCRKRGGVTCCMFTVQTSEHFCQKDDSTRFETSQKYKTEICKNFMIHKKCKFEDRCCFAHGLHELREKSSLNNSYKLKVCKNYQQNGFCRYGQRCQYVHLKNNEIFNEILNTNVSKLCSKLNENPEEKLATLLEGLGSLKNRLPIFVKLSKQK